MTVDTWLTELSEDDPFVAFSAGYIYNVKRAFQFLQVNN